MTSTKPGRHRPDVAAASVTASPWVRRRWRSGPRSKPKAAAALCAAMAGLAALAIAQARPASADPFQEYVAVGSDTTQDVFNQFALDLGGNAIGSWNAINPVTANPHEIITRGGNCSFTRPNGSTEGENELRKSINPTTAAPQLAAPPQQNCIDIARSSVAPGSDQKTDGQLIFIPYALDAVTTAIGAGATSTFATDVNSLTSAQLTTLYNTCTAVTVNGTSYNPGTGGNIHLYVPQPGSGDLKFWASKTGGWNAAAPPACDHQAILAGPSTGLAVEQNDGTAVNSDPIGIMPFSIAQWLSQSNGNDDRRHGAVLHEINNTFPCTGNAACPASGGTLNTSFPFTREVYNIVAYDRVVNTGDGKFDPNLASLLVGTGSALCQDTFTIQDFGFALLGTPQTTDNCGSTSNTLRAFDSTDPV